MNDHTLALTRPQTEFFTSEEKATAMVSGFGAGKTAAAIARLLATKFMFPEVDLLYCAPTYPLIKDIMYVEMRKICGEAGVPLSINLQDNDIRFQGAGRILCRTMDKPERLIGFNVGDAVLDELDTLPTDKAMDVWRKVLARTRTPFPNGKKNQMFVPTTPEGFKAVYELFKKNPAPGYRLIQAPTSSNPHLPEDYVQTLKNTYPSQLIAAYLEGQFVNLTSGAVYYAFDRERNGTHYVARPREVLHIGMDFNVYKMAAIVHVQRGDKLYAVDELIGLRDTPDMIAAIEERFEGHPIYVYPDASGKAKSSKGSTLSDHKLLREAGFRLRSKKTNPLVRDRLASMNAGFEYQQYYVNTQRCPVYAECLEQQVFDKNGTPDKSNDWDHPVDAGGYCKHYMMPVVKPKVIERQLGGL